MHCRAFCHCLKHAGTRIASDSTASNSTAIKHLQNPNRGQVHQSVIFELLY
jgi:hypothetical protein